MLLYAPKTLPVGAVVFPHSGSRLEVVDHEGRAAILDVPEGDEFAVRDLGFTEEAPAADDVAQAQPEAEVPVSQDGTPLTPDLVATLSAEAEGGYDPNQGSAQHREEAH